MICRCPSDSRDGTTALKLAVRLPTSLPMLQVLTPTQRGAPRWWDHSCGKPPLKAIEVRNLLIRGSIVT